MTFDDVCSEYRAIGEKYIETITQMTAELLSHVKDCVHCKQYLMDHRDDMTLKSLLMSDQDFIKMIDSMADELGKDES